jgi:hypothetical protein
MTDRELQENVQKALDWEPLLREPLSLTSPRQGSGPLHLTGETARSSDLNAASARFPPGPGNFPHIARRVSVCQPKSVVHAQKNPRRRPRLNRGRSP